MKKAIAIIVFGLFLCGNVEAQIKNISSDSGIAYYIDKKYNLTDYEVDAEKYCKTKGKSSAALTQRSLMESNSSIYTYDYSQLLKAYKEGIKNKYAKSKMIMFFCIDSSKELGKEKLVWASDSTIKAQREIVEEEKKELKKLNIEIKKAIEETDVIKINEAYSLKCEAKIQDLNLTTVLKVVNSKKLKWEGIISFGEDGDLYVKYDAKISSKGKISPQKPKLHYSTNFDKDLKKSMKKQEDMIKHVSHNNSIAYNIYGKTLIPIQIKDKKKTKQMLDLVKMLGINDNEMKKIVKHVKVNFYDHYLGIANIQEEKFYVVNSYLELKHPDEEWNEFFNEMSEETLLYTLVHVDSGYSIPISNEMESTCTIYKQNKEVIKIDSSDIIY